MEISASETTRALRRTVYPILKEQGFDDWTTRKAWRRRNGRIEHMEFRSFNSYFADSFNCTPASVSVWIGIQIPELRIEHNPSLGPKGLRPGEAGMPIRGELAPSVGLRQRNALNIWNIRSIEDAEAAAFDIAHQIRACALDWLNFTFDIAELISFLMNSPTENLQTRPNGARFWIDAGNPDSPRRNQMIGDLAKSCGEFLLAAERYERSRWALNVKTRQRYLYLAPDQDSEVRRMAEECRAKL